MPKSLRLLVLLAVVFSACVSIAEFPEGARVQAPLPQTIQLVIIQPTTMGPGTLKNAEGLTDAPQFFVRSLKNALETKQPGWQIRMVDEQSDISGADIAIRTHLVSIDGGSAGLRFWIGFSAGAAESTVDATILDKTGKELAAAKISERTMCPVGACVESNEATVRRNLQSLTADVTEFIASPAQYEKKKASGSSAD